jgi:hypothetical protein
MRRTRFLAALAATALLFAACGDDTTETATEGEPVAETSETETLEGASLDLTVEADAKKGFNLLTQIEGFTFTPENASSDHVAGEGHAHIYVDGEKIARLYTADYYLGDLAEGPHDIMVELNTNDHRPYVDADGEPITASASIEVPASEDMHSHMDLESETLDGAAISFSVEPDAKAGFNLVGEVEGFTFDAAAASTPSVAGEGHAHLYVDGEKITRLYGPAYHLTGLTEGSHEVMVELNTNDHRPYVDGNGDPVASTVTIEVTADQAQAAGEGHSHGGDDMSDMNDMEDMPADESTGDAASGTVTVVVAGGAAEGPDRVEATTGETVSVTATSDVADEIHVHGTDDRFDIAAGETLDFEFVADIPGVFEVELENNGILLFELAVR